MSFERFKFIFNPPKTVSPAPQEGTAAALATEVDPNLQQRSQSANLAVKLSEMVAASRYLQQAVLDRVRDMGVVIDAGVDPDTARALVQVYGIDPPPSTITMPMYDHLLDAEVGSARLELTLGNDSTVEPNIFQAADLAQITSTVEEHLLEGDSFKHHVPTVLRQLKGDEVIFQHWRDQLAQYPTFNQQFNRTVLESIRDKPPNSNTSLISASNIDISPELNAYLDSHLDKTASLYSSTYKLLSQPSAVEQDLPAVAGSFFEQGAAHLVRLMAALNSLRSLTLKPRLSDVADDLSQFVYVRLLSDSGAHAFELDRLVQMITKPLQGLTGQMGSLLGNVQNQVSSLGRTTGGGLRNSAGGMVADLPHNPTAPVNNDGLSAGLRSLGQHVEWSQHEITRKQDLVQESFRKMAERRSNTQGDRLNLLSSLQAVESFVNLAKGFVDQSKQGSVQPGASGPQRLETVGRILSNLRSSTSSSLVIQDGQVIVTPPDMPAVPPVVEKVLRRGGLNRALGSDLRIIKVIL